MSVHGRAATNEKGKLKEVLNRFCRKLTTASFVIRSNRAVNIRSNICIFFYMLYPTGTLAKPMGPKIVLSDLPLFFSFEEAC